MGGTGRSNSASTVEAAALKVSAPKGAETAVSVVEGAVVVLPNALVLKEAASDDSV